MAAGQATGQEMPDEQRGSQKKRAGADQALLQDAADVAGGRTATMEQQELGAERSAVRHEARVRTRVNNFE